MIYYICKKNTSLRTETILVWRFVWGSASRIIPSRAKCTYLWYTNTVFHGAMLGLTLQLQWFPTNRIQWF